MKLKVGVIFGGESVEHEISIISANQVINALDKNKYEVYPIYISKKGDFYTGESLNNMETFKDLNSACENANQVYLKKNQNKTEIHLATTKLFKKSLVTEIDVFFPVVHGTNGEDGKLQGLLEMMHATFVGTNTKAAVNGQDKIFMKNILRDNKIKVVDFIWFYSTDFDNNKAYLLNKIEERLNYPVIIKPANLGSSIGISKASNRQELVDGIEEAFKYDMKVIIEKAVNNLKEVNCSVIGDFETQEASVIEEVIQSDEILSFDDKYQGGSKSKTNTKSQGMASTNRIIPANISSELTLKIEEISQEAFKVLNLSGVTRIDYLIDEETQEVYLNEVNTIPGSLSFYLWQPKGLEFNQLCDKLIALAIKRTRDESNLITTFDSNVLHNFKSNSKNKVNQ